MKHTATPWRYVPENGSPTTGRHMIAGAVPGYLAEVREYKSNAQAKADAELIVRAVNSHSALVSALEQVLGDCIFPGAAISDVYENVQKALALAKGE